MHLGFRQLVLRFGNDHIMANVRWEYVKCTTSTHGKQQGDDKIANHCGFYIDRTFLSVCSLHAHGVG